MLRLSLLCHSAIPFINLFLCGGETCRASVKHCKSLWLIFFFWFVFSFSALLSWCHRHDSGSAFISNFSRLLDAVGQCEECVLKHLKSVRQQPSVVDILGSMEDMDLCHVVPAERETNDAENEGLTHEESVEGSKICSEHPSGMHSSDSKHSSTQEHACSEHPGFTWILEQTTSLVEQLGLSVDVLQHLKQL